MWLACAEIFLIASLVPEPAATPTPTASRDSQAVILEGMRVYKDEGAQAALKAWLKGSPLEGSKEALAQANTLRQIEDFYGKYQSVRVARSVALTETAELTYVQMDYEKGPLYGKFHTFKTRYGWILVSFKFHTEPEQVWPWDLISQSTSR